MKFLRELSKSELRGVKVLVRVDFNVPVVKGRVTNDFRVRMALPTLAFLKDAGAKIIMVSHIETAETDGGPTLEPLVHTLKMLGISVSFIKNYKNARTEIENLAEGGMILLENIRMHAGEKTNDKAFAKELASLADIYVNDAFAVSHREHASICAVTDFLPSYAGFLLEKEITHLKTALNPESSDRPFLFILGGAKFETKLSLVEKFMNIADFVFIGGALANDFFKEAGYEVGKSLVSNQKFNLSRFSGSPKLLLPSDAVTGAATKSIQNILPDETIYDAGPETLKMLSEKISQAKYILWNGPLGAYEKGYKKPTLVLAHKIAESTVRGTKTIIGGGDTLAAIAELGVEDKFTFVSTGGGAMLDFLANETTAGVEALEKNRGN